MASSVAELFGPFGVFGPIGESWLPIFHNEFQKQYFKKLCDNVIKESDEHHIYPPLGEVFYWTRVCPLDTVKVVILGQNPYSKPHLAHGLAFSAKIGLPVPYSLTNVFNALEKDDVAFEKPAHGCLIGWAEQGVLLLNAALTLQDGARNPAIDDGWKNLTKAIISYLSKYMTGIVFMLWGSEAKDNLIDQKIITNTVEIVLDTLLCEMREQELTVDMATSKLKEYKTQLQESQKGVETVIRTLLKEVCSGDLTCDMTSLKLDEFEAQRQELITNGVVKVLNTFVHELGKRGKTFNRTISKLKEFEAQRQKKHLVLTAPLPTQRNRDDGEKFSNCGHFSKCNQHLTKVGKTAVNWSYLPPLKQQSDGN